MAPIGTIQFAGNVNAGPAEVELNTLALRTVIRPGDTKINGILRGSYSLALPVRKLANASTAPPTLPLGLIVITNETAAYEIVIKKLTMSLVLEVAGTGAAGFYAFEAFRNGDVNNSSGLALAKQITAPVPKLSEFVEPATLSFGISAAPGGAANATATTPSTLSITDTQSFFGVDGSLQGSGSAMSNTYSVGAADHPIILSTYEALSLQITAAPTWSTATTISYYATVVWDEYEVY